MHNFKISDQVTLNPEHYSEEFQTKGEFHFLAIPANEVGTVTSVSANFVFVTWNGPAVNQNHFDVDYYHYRLLPYPPKPKRKL